MRTMRFVQRLAVLGLAVLVAFEFGHSLPQSNPTFPEADGSVQALSCSPTGKATADCVLPVQVAQNGPQQLACTTTEVDANGNPSSQICWPIVRP